MSDGKIKQLGNAESLDPKTMLLDAAKDAHEYDDVVIVIMRKDGGATKWCTSTKPWFLAGCALIIQDLALDALNGRVVSQRSR